MLQDDLNLTMTVEPLRFRMGEEVVVRHRVLNEGRGAVEWERGGCGAAWQREVASGAGETVAWQRPDRVCDEPVQRTALGPGEVVEAETRWDGRDRSSDPPAAAEPGQYRFTVGFRYQQSDGPWRLITADALVELQAS